MKIAIVTLTTTARRTGVAEYLIHLIDELQRIDKVNEYYIFTGRDNRYMFTLSAPNFREVRLQLTHDPGLIMRPIFHFWQIFLLPVWCYFKKIDVIHLPNTLFVSGIFPTISTLHDVVEYKVPKYSTVRTFFRKLMIRSAIRNSKQIITVSESSARDLSSLGGKNVIPIHLGFTNPFPSLPDATQQNEVLMKYNLVNTSFVLFIGTQLKHKNIPVLIAAFKLVKETHISVKLVLVGAPDNDSDNVHEAIRKNDLSNEVYLLNYLSSEEKLIILKNAKVFCLISSYEGFGIPILEAQAAGVPIIVNNISSLPEVSGAGALLVQPSKLMEDTAMHITRLLNDEALRRELIEKGYKNIKRFSWQTFAEKTLKVYSEFNQL